METLNETETKRFKRLTVNGNETQTKRKRNANETQTERKRNGKRCKE